MEAGYLSAILSGMKACLPAISTQPAEWLRIAVHRLALAAWGGAILFLMAFTGCVGVVGDGGYGGAAVVVPGPDFYIFGGGYDRGYDEHRFSHRGYESRSGAHGQGGHGGRR